MPISGVERMLAREDQRRAGDQALQLGEGDDRAGEGDRADRQAEAHLDQAARLDRAGDADAEGLRREKAAPATKTAARPTRLWKAATSCGSAVIWMRSAMKVPIAPPITMPREDQPRSSRPAAWPAWCDGDRPCRRCRADCRRAM